MKYVALLRGINVGGNNKVPMSELKTCVEELGFENVSTYINSGNVIFEADKTKESDLALKIEKAIHVHFGFPVQVVVRSQKNIEKVAKTIPEDWENDIHKTDILFLWDEYASKKSLRLIEPKEGIDNLIYTNGAIVWNLDRKNYSKSAMNRFIGTELYKNMTARNVNTVRKLFDLMKD